MRPAWVTVALITATVSAVVPCTFEIPSLRDAVKEEPLIVIGTVESVVGDSVQIGDLPTVMVPRSATFLVEEVLKGPPQPLRLELFFDPEYAFPRSSCGELHVVYFTGSRFVLLLDEPTASGAYRAPLIDPWRMRLSSEADYKATPLYQYLTRLVAGEASAVSVEFEAQGTQRVGEPLRVTVTVTNDLDRPLQLWLGRPAYGHTGLGLRLSVYGVTPSSYDTPADVLGVVEVGAESVKSVDLADVFTVSEAGARIIKGYLYVPNGAPALEFPPERSEFFDILHGQHGSLWSYQAEMKTSLDEWTWGAVKGRHSSAP